MDDRHKIELLLNLLLFACILGVPIIVMFYIVTFKLIDKFLNKLTGKPEETLRDAPEERLPAS